MDDVLYVPYGEESLSNRKLLLEELLLLGWVYDGQTSLKDYLGNLIRVWVIRRKEEVKRRLSCGKTG